MDVLAAEPDIEVVGTAPNGRIALAKLSQVKPDIVTLDIEMPEMDGLECLVEIRKVHPSMPVIMFSTLTERGAIATLDALARGASDYVTKPSGVGSVGAAMDRVRADLIPKIRGLCWRVTGQLPTAQRLALGAAKQPTGPTARQPRAAEPRPERSRIDVVAIGVSTGGPNALAALIPALPADLSVPVVIVQHMPPLFTKLLADRLQTRTTLPVAEARPGVEMRPGQVWLARGDWHLTVNRDGAKVVLGTSQDPPENSCRPAVDVLFRSVASIYRQHSLGVVLTGMGQDGLRGAELIREAGGQVLAQDEATSVVWGMPGLVARAGLADKVLPLDTIAGEIAARLREGRAVPAARTATANMEP